MSKAHKNRVKRIAQPAASRLTDPERVEIMLAPYLHLQQLLDTGEPNPYYLASIVGVLNVATALAYLHKDKRSIRLYESVQHTLLDVARQGIADEESGERLQRVFVIADNYIAVQSKTDVLRAIRLVEFQIEHGEGSMPLPSPD